MVVIERASFAYEFPIQLAIFNVSLLATNVLMQSWLVVVVVSVSVCLGALLGFMPRAADKAKRALQARVTQPIPPCVHQAIAIPHDTSSLQMASKRKDNGTSKTQNDSSKVFNTVSDCVSCSPSRKFLGTFTDARESEAGL